MLQLIQKIDAGVATAERWLVIVLTVALTVIMMAQVVFRYFFHSPIFWAEEVAVQLLVFVTVFGLALLVQQKQLVTIDFVARALKGRTRSAVMALLALVALAIFVFVTWYAWDWIQREDVRMELSATTQLPRWYNYAALPVAMTLMTWHQFVVFLREVQAAVKGSEQ